MQTAEQIRHVVNAAKIPSINARYDADDTGRARQLLHVPHATGVLSGVRVSGTCLVWHLRAARWLLEDACLCSPQAWAWSVSQALAALATRATDEATSRRFCSHACEVHTRCPQRSGGGSGAASRNGSRSAACEWRGGAAVAISWRAAVPCRQVRGASKAQHPRATSLLRGSCQSARASKCATAG